MPEPLFTPTYLTFSLSLSSPLGTSCFCSVVCNSWYTSTCNVIALLEQGFTLVLG